MKVGISIEIDENMMHLTDYVNSLSDFIEEAMAVSSYGKGVERADIGFVCIFNSHLFPEREFKYRKIQKVKRLDGSMINIENAISFDVKVHPDIYDGLYKSSAINIAKILREIFVSRIIELSAELHKLNEFNSDEFVSDSVECFYLWEKKISENFRKSCSEDINMWQSK